MNKIIIHRIFIILVWLNYGEDSRLLFEAGFWQAKKI
jgi:hypothetical protein